VDRIRLEQRLAEANRIIKEQEAKLKEQASIIREEKDKNNELTLNLMLYTSGIRRTGNMNIPIYPNPIQCVAVSSSEDTTEEDPS
jgi:hypothetical protein